VPAPVTLTADGTQFRLQLKPGEGTVISLAH
jgi:hypothetical protein